MHIASGAEPSVILTPESKAREDAKLVEMMIDG
jgi:hypothetical protein